MINPTILKAFLVLFCFSLFNTSGQTTNIEESNTEGKKYCNVRYDFCMEYPEEIFTTIEYSVNGDGIIAQSRDGKIEFIAAGFNNVLETSIDEEYELFLKSVTKNEGKIQVLKTDKNKDYFESTIITGSKFIYIKAFKKENDFVTLTIKADKNIDIEELKEQIYFSSEF